MNIPDGGSAFAAAAENGYTPGMTLRDYFAGQAVIALIGLDSDATVRELSADAYDHADSMLRQREVGQ